MQGSKEEKKRKAGEESWGVLGSSWLKRQDRAGDSPRAKGFLAAAGFVSRDFGAPLLLLRQADRLNHLAFC